MLVHVTCAVTLWDFFFFFFLDRYLRKTPRPPAEACNISLQHLRSCCNDEQIRSVIQRLSNLEELDVTVASDEGRWQRKNKEEKNVKKSFVIRKIKMCIQYKIGKIYKYCLMNKRKMLKKKSAFFLC